MDANYRPCECPVAGYCSRYKQEMSESKWKICQSYHRYRMLWDETAGNADHGIIMSKKKGNLPQNIKHNISIEKIDPNSQLGQKIIKRREVKNKRKKQDMGVMKDNEDVRNAVKKLQKETGKELEDIIKNPEGLGDTVHNILASFGITEKRLQKVINRTCGCDKRRKWLNKLMPYINKSTD
jgi:hypothetical protein